MNLNEECLLQFLSHGKKAASEQSAAGKTADNPIKEEARRRNPFTDKPQRQNNPS